MPNQELHIDKMYHFDEHKHIEDADLPVGAKIALGLTDSQYRKDPVDYFQRVIETVRMPVVEDGAPYTMATEPGASKDTAVVVAVPFANGVYPQERDPSKIANVLATLNDPQASKSAKKEAKAAFDSNSMSNPIRHLLLFDMLKHMSVRDEAGYVIPVIAIGGASEDYDPQLTREQKKAQRRGSMRTDVHNAVDILRHEGIGQLHSAGYSAGASVAASLACVHGGLGFDLRGAVIAEPTTYKRRSIGALMVNNMLNKPLPEGTPKNDSGIQSSEKWTEHGPQSRKDLEQVTNQFMKHQGATIIKRGGANAAMALRHDTLAVRLEGALAEHGPFPLTIAWNGTSAITHDIETTFFNPANERNAAVLERFRSQGMLRTAKAVGHAAVGAPHLAGESPMYYAAMMAESIAWAQRKK